MTEFDVLEDGSVVWDGRKVSMDTTHKGKVILNVDGKRIKLSDERCMALYTFFFVMSMNMDKQEDWKAYIN